MLQRNVGGVAPVQAWVLREGAGVLLEAAAADAAAAEFLTVAISRTPK